MFEGFRARDLLLAVISTFFFGASFPLLKYALQVLPPLFFAFVRAVFTALFFILFFIVAGKSIKFPRGKAATSALMVAIFSVTYPSVAQNFGIILLDPSSAATISSLFQSTSPIFTTILALIFLKEPLTRYKSLGASISFTGIVLLTLEGKDLGELRSAATLGGLLILSTALSYSISGIIIKKTLSFYPRLELLLWSNIISAALYVPAVGSAWYAGAENPDFGSLLSPSILASILVLAFVVGGVAMIIWYRLIETYPISRLTHFSYLIPLFAGLLSFTVMGERLTSSGILYALLIILGVYIVQRPERVGGHDKC